MLLFVPEYDGSRRMRSCGAARELDRALLGLTVAAVAAFLLMVGILLHRRGVSRNP
jgi:hypothetical protein